MGYKLTRKECISGMKYNNNDDIVALVDNYLNIHGIKKTFLAEKMGITRQRLNTIFQKKNINLDDLKQIADALGLDVEINLVEKKKRVLGKKEEDFKELEREQRRLMDNATRGVEAVAQRGVGNMEALAMAIEDIYKRLDRLDKKNEKE